MKSPVKIGESGHMHGIDFEKTEDSSDDSEDEASWKKSAHFEELEKEIREVVAHLTECKEHIAGILIQIITLLLDIDISEIEKSRNYTVSNAEIKSYLKENSPFFNRDTFVPIESIVFNYLTKETCIAGIELMTYEARFMIDTAFKYVSTIDDDFFWRSLTSIGEEHILWAKNYEMYLNWESDLSKQAESFRNDLIALFLRATNAQFVEPKYTPTQMFKSKTLTNPTEIREDSHHAPVCDYNINEQLNDDIDTLREKMKDALLQNMGDKSEKKRGKLKFFMGNHNLPLIWMALVEFMSRLHDNFLTKAKGVSWINYDTLCLKYYQTMSKIFGLLNDICMDNAFAKAQLFKSDGAYYFLELLNKGDVNSAIF